MAQVPSTFKVISPEKGTFADVVRNGSPTKAASPKPSPGQEKVVKKLRQATIAFTTRVAKPSPRQEPGNKKNEVIVIDLDSPSSKVVRLRRNRI